MFFLILFQLKVMPFGKDNLLLLSDETRKIMYDAARKVPENVVPPVPNVPAAAAVAEKRWRVGGLEFEALMRMLDNAVSVVFIFWSYLGGLSRGWGGRGGTRAPSP